MAGGWPLLRMVRPVLGVEAFWIDARGATVGRCRDDLVTGVVQRQVGLIQLAEEVAGRAPFAVLQDLLFGSAQHEQHLAGRPQRGGRSRRNLRTVTWLLVRTRRAAESERKRQDRGDETSPKRGARRHAVRMNDGGAGSLDLDQEALLPR